MNNIFGDIIGNKLGQLKLEHIIEKAVFLAPKAYYLETDSAEKIIKIKGLNAGVIKNLSDSDDLNLDTFIKILHKDGEQIVEQKKSVKNLFDGTLDIIEQTYSIKHNDNKRDLIYNDLDILVDTKPKNLELLLTDNKLDIIKAKKNSTKKKKLS